jgi:hypothetical protein
MYRAGMMADAREYLAKLLGMGPELESARARLMEAMEVLEGDDELAVADEEVAASGDTRYLRAVQAMVDGQDQKALRLFEAFPGLEEEGPAYRSLYAYLLYRGNWRWRAKKAVEPLLREEDYIQDHPEVLYYAARIFWLVDENHRATEVALRYVDLRRAARAARTLEDLATEKASGVRYLGPF